MRWVATRGCGISVSLAVPLHRVGIECVGVARNEGRSDRQQNVVEAAIEFSAGAHLDAGRIDTFLVDEILLDVKVALSGGVGCFIGGVPADDYEFGGRVAIEGEGDFVEAALGFVVDAYGAFSVALEGDAAEIAWLRCDRGRRSRDCDCGVGSGLLAEVIDDVAGDVDGAWSYTRGGESCGRGAAGDLAGGCGVGVGESSVLGTAGDRGDGGGVAGQYCAGIGRAGDGGRIIGVDTEACGAVCLLAGTHTFGDVAGDGVVSWGKARGGDGCGGIFAGDRATVGGPGVVGLFLQVEVGRDGCDCDGVAGEDVCGFSCAAQLDRWRRGDFSEPENDASGEAIGGDFADASGNLARVNCAVVDVRVVKVGLNGPEGEVVVEDGKNVVDAASRGDSPAPGAGLEDRSADFCAAAESVNEGNEAICW